MSRLLKIPRVYVPNYMYSTVYILYMYIRYRYLVLYFQVRLPSIASSANTANYIPTCTGVCIGGWPSSGEELGGKADGVDVVGLWYSAM